MAKYVFTKARRLALEKARKKWMSMSPAERRKKMPARNPHPTKRYPVGSILTLDVGRPKHHYLHVQKLKYGWKAGPLREYGGGSTSGTLIKKRGYVRRAYTYRRGNKLVRVKATRVKPTKFYLD